MTPNNTNEETRFMNYNGNGANANEETVVNEETVINPAAPVSRAQDKAHRQRAAKGGKRNAAFAAGGFVAGAAVGAGISAMASSKGSAPEVKGLSKAATPDQEMTPEELADSMAERENPAILNDEHPAEPARVTVIEDEPATKAATTSAATAGKPNEIIGENPIVNPGEHTAPADSVTEVHQVADPEMQIEVLDEDNNVILIDVDGPDSQPAIQEVQDLYLHDMNVPDPSEVIIANSNGVLYAHVDDDMNFSEAFEAARTQVGPGGVFEWHGNTYGTYYAEEWNQMSVEDRGQFLQAVDLPANLDSEAPVLDPTVEITEMSVTVNAQGEVVTTAHLVVSQGDEHLDVYMVDTNHDDIADVMVLDINDDDIYTPENDVTVDISDQNVSMTEMGNAMLETPEMGMNDMADTDFDSTMPTEY